MLRLHKDFFEENGYLGPLRAISTEDAAESRDAFTRELEASRARFPIRRLLMPGRLRRSLATAAGLQPLPEPADRQVLRLTAMLRSRARRILQYRFSGSMCPVVE